MYLQNEWPLFIFDPLSLNKQIAFIKQIKLNKQTKKEKKNNLNTCNWNASEIDDIHLR